MAKVQSSFGGATIDSRKLAELLQGEDGPVIRHVMKLGDRVKAEAKERVGVSEPDPVPRRKPHKPGNLRDHIVKRLVMRGNTVVVLVGADVDYAMFHHQGTKPHRIPKSGNKLLVFYWKNAPSELGGPGIYHFLHVNHPGTKPNPFLTDALRAVRGD